MIYVRPRTLIIIGAVLVLLGFILPLLILLKVLESTFFLNFLAFIASLLGLILGILGAAQYAVEVRRKRDE